MRASEPTGTMLSPLATPFVISTRSPCRIVYSIITTASAPSGAGAPVMMPAACPGRISRGRSSTAAPALISPTTCSVAGSSRQVCRPHRVSIAHGTAKRREVAVREPLPAPTPSHRWISRSTLSVPPGRPSRACRSTTWRASSKLRIVGGCGAAAMPLMIAVGS